jgi:hypothetical protein
MLKYKRAECKMEQDSASVVEDPHEHFECTRWLKRCKSQETSGKIFIMTGHHGRPELGAILEGVPQSSQRIEGGEWEPIEFSAHCTSAARKQDLPVSRRR